MGRGLGLTTPLITANSVSFFLTRSAFIQSQNVFTSTSNRRRFRRALQLHFSVRRESNERGNCTVLAVHALQHMHKGAGAYIACIISYQIAKETTSMQCRDQLSHEVTKKAIKAAIKLCMHVMLYIIYIKNMSLKRFSKLS